MVPQELTYSTWDYPQVMRLSYGTKQRLRKLELCIKAVLTLDQIFF
jgi:hypothetical protein